MGLWARSEKKPPVHEKAWVLKEKAEAPSPLDEKLSQKRLSSAYSHLS